MPIAPQFSSTQLTHCPTLLLSLPHLPVSAAVHWALVLGWASGAAQPPFPPTTAIFFMAGASGSRRLSFFSSTTPSSVGSNGLSQTIACEMAGADGLTCCTERKRAVRRGVESRLRRGRVSQGLLEQAERELGLENAACVALDIVERRQPLRDGLREVRVCRLVSALEVQVDAACDALRAGV